MNKKIGLIVIILATAILSLLIFLKLNQKVEVYVNYVGGGENYTLKIKKGTCIDQPEEPVLSGFVFEYWSVDNKEFDFSTEITESITLLAKYEKAYDVIFISEGTVLKEMIVSQGDYAVAPKDMSNGDFVFEGWYENDKAYSLDEPVMRNLTLVAKWVNPISYLEAESEPLEMEPYEQYNVFSMFHYLPSNAQFTPSYSSDNPNVAKVDDQGNVVSVSIGTAYITMKVGTLSAKVRVDVVKPKIRSITTPSTINVDCDNTIQLQCYIIPENGDTSTLKYSIEDTELASVDENGLITAHKAGATKVIVSSGDVVSESALYINGTYVELQILDSTQTYYPSGPEIDYSLNLITYLNGERSEEDLRNNAEIILNDNSNDGCLQIDEENNLKLNNKNKETSKETFFFTYGEYVSNTVEYGREPILDITFNENCDESSSYYEGLCLVKMVDLKQSVTLTTSLEMAGFEALSEAVTDWSYENSVLTFTIDADKVNGAETAFVAVSNGGQMLEIRVSGPNIKSE